MNETYIKIKGVSEYIHCAVDKQCRSINISATENSETEPTKIPASVQAD